MSTMVHSNGEEIAPDGDVIFLVGGDKTRLRVSSAILSAASPVFEALLGPHFREGQQSRSPTAPVEIVLPEDKAEPMSQMCHLLHYKQTPDLNADMPTDRLLHFAIVVDKYDCGQALQLQCRGLILQWISDNTGRSNVQDLWNVATAALLLRDDRLFAEATDMLVVETDRDLTVLRRMEAGEWMPLNVLVAIQQKRSNIQNAIYNQVESLTHCDEHTRTDDDKLLDRIANYITGENRRWPPNFAQVSVQDACIGLANFGRILLTCKHCNWYNYLDLNHFRGYVTGYRGLCLTCVLEDWVEIGGRGTCERHG